MKTLNEANKPLACKKSVLVVLATSAFRFGSTSKACRSLFWPLRVNRYGRPTQRASWRLSRSRADTLARVLVRLSTRRLPGTRREGAVWVLMHRSCRGWFTWVNSTNVTRSGQILMHGLLEYLWLTCCVVFLSVLIFFLHILLHLVVALLVGVVARQDAQKRVVSLARGRWRRPRIGVGEVIESWDGPR